MNLPTYRQEREGEFKANLIPTNQCGFRVGQHTFKYHATIVVDQLDENGWVIDNKDLDKLFNKWDTGEWLASCEDLAGGGVAQILSALGDRAMSVNVTIIPNQFAQLECDWQRGDDDPHWIPRLAQLQSAMSPTPTASQAAALAVDMH